MFQDLRFGYQVQLGVAKGTIFQCTPDHVSGHTALPLCVDESGGWRPDSVLKVKLGLYGSSIRTMRNCIFVCLVDVLKMMERK